MFLKQLLNAHGSAVYVQPLFWWSIVVALPGCLPLKLMDGNKVL